MAGQPHEPWQSYSPPSADNQDTYTYPPSGGQDPRTVRGAEGAQDQALTRQDPFFPGQAIGDQEYPGPGSEGAPHWRGAPGAQSSAQSSAQSFARAGGDARGFFAALFDFSFTSFVTPKIIKVLYVLYTIWMVVWALIFIRIGFKYGGGAGGIFTLLVVDPIFLLLTIGAYRVILELFMVVHRMHEDLKAIRERSGDGG